MFLWLSLSTTKWFFIFNYYFWCFQKGDCMKDKNVYFVMIKSSAIETGGLKFECQLILVRLVYQHFCLRQRNRSRYYKSRSTATYNPFSFNLFCGNENNFSDLSLLDNLYLEREQNKNLWIWWKLVVDKMSA